MSRMPRILSKTGIYHIMLRGNDRQKVFNAQEDKDQFVAILLERREKADFSIYAYCVLDNHVHLVLREQDTAIANVIKSIGVRYAHYFNKKYERIGHVFQDRYRSENVEDEAYLLTVVRYVHHNPEHAGICKAIDYLWSSYPFYALDAGLSQLAEIEDILTIFSSDIPKARAQFTEFSKLPGEDHTIMDIDDNRPDIEAKIKQRMDHYLHESKLTLGELKQKKNQSVRDKLIMDIAARSGWSIRKIAAITGLNREMVRSAVAYRYN